MLPVKLLFIVQSL